MQEKAPALFVLNVNGMCLIHFWHIYRTAHKRNAEMLEKNWYKTAIGNCGLELITRAIMYIVVLMDFIQEACVTSCIGVTAFQTAPEGSKTR